MQLEELKHISVQATPGTKVYWPKEDRIGALDMSRVAAKFGGHPVYNYGGKRNHKTLAFIDENSNFYVVPCTSERINTLIENGFAREDFYVPFSHGDIPFDGQELWLASTKL
ncbi:hypothetical protein IJH26_01840 [Candidatus Saccharibacteria bacterium]|nr:hypothetical protein [Candidatus Saccharibacteria bacterium]